MQGTETPACLTAQRFAIHSLRRSADAPRYSTLLFLKP